MNNNNNRKKIKNKNIVYVENILYTYDKKAPMMYVIKLSDVYKNSYIFALYNVEYACKYEVKQSKIGDR